jgi:hypothetical protein
MLCPTNRHAWLTPPRHTPTLPGPTVCCAHIGDIRRRLGERAKSTLCYLPDRPGTEEMRQRSDARSDQRRSWPPSLVIRNSITIRRPEVSGWRRAVTAGRFRSCRAPRPSVTQLVLAASLLARPIQCRSTRRVVLAAGRRAQRTFCNAFSNFGGILIGSERFSFTFPHMFSNKIVFGWSGDMCGDAGSTLPSGCLPGGNCNN